jgi:sugar phosphate isomerase/epimerase
VPAAEPYLLGCQTLPYAAHPLARALEGIRKAGYRYVMLNQVHAGQPAFTPALSPAARTELRARLRDAGLTPFMSFLGRSADIRQPGALKAWQDEMDLNVEFGIRIAVTAGPWYYATFPNVPKRARDWQKECDEFYPALERAVRHAESVGFTITLKPHTGITMHAKACLQLLARIPSERLKISWDAGNVSFYEGIYPDPDLPDLAPHVKAVCIKDHRGPRGEVNFPVPGAGQIDHEQMFRILLGAGFNGPIAVERVNGADRGPDPDAERIDQRLAAARSYVAPLLERLTRKL